MSELRYYATGDKQLTLGDSLGISQATLSCCITQATNWLNRLGPQYIFPRGEQLNAVRQGFHRTFQFPGISGLIDGTHVRIVAPSINEDVYVKRKGFHSVNVQVVCNDRNEFTNVVAR